MNKKMAALSLYGVGDLRLIETGVPVCGENEVLIKIKNCGICGSDIGRIFKTGTYHFPTIPGHEFAGEVVFDPDGRLNGKRMVVFPLLPCFVCEMCKKGRYAQCSSYDYYGSRCNGAFAEYIAVKKFNLLEIPNSVSFEEGAMCEPVSVALHAVKKAGIKKGDTVLVSGAGPIGLIAGQWAKILGAKRVRMFDIDSEKIEFCRKSGFSEYQKNDKFQIAIEGTGAGDALARIIKGISPGGTIVLMGNPANEVSLSAENYQLILRKELKLKGTWNSSYSDMDGIFVPNYTLGTDYCRAIRENSDIPLDIHMMVEKPEDKIDFFDIRERDIVSVHAETTAHLQRTLTKIKERGAKAYVALNPATPICFLENIMQDIDGVLVMTVNPGFAGQKLIPQTLEKITAVRKMLDTAGKDCEIEVDGNVSFQNAKKMRAAGADIFVAGTSSVFAKDISLHDGILKLRESIR